MCEASVAAERVRLCERRQVEVPVRLPEVLDVPDLALVAIVDRMSGPPRRESLRERIAVPLRGHAQRAILQVEHGMTAGEHALGPGDDRESLLRQRIEPAEMRQETAHPRLGVR